jgi:hypothetical protein
MNQLNSAILISILNVLIFIASAASTPASANPVEIAELKKQLDILARKIELLEQQQNAVNPERQPTIGPVTATISKPPEDYDSDIIAIGGIPGAFNLPGTNTSMLINGYVNTNVIYDIGPRPLSRGGDVSSADAAILEGTPEYENRGDFRISARDSRFGIRTFTPTDIGELRTVIEGDFNGPPDDKAFRAISSRTAFGIRLAYGELGGFLFGQSFSNYLNTSVFPRKLDGAGPVGRSFIRQGQLRYTHRFDPESRLAIALENPRGDFYDANDDNLDDALPDLTANYRYETSRWHLQFSGVLRRMGVEEGMPNGASDSVTGWGVNQSGAFFLPGGQDRISWYINFGDGIGRYMEAGSDQGASITPEGKLDTQFGYGGFVTYRHWWTQTLQSNFALGLARYNLNPDEDAEAHRSLISSHVNLIWSPLAQVEFGMEYIWAHRRVHDGREGAINRVQFNSKYFF